MTLAAIPWLTISINLLMVIFVIVCLLMILLVLMQRPKQEGLGAAFGGGVTDQVFGARTTNVLQRGTVYLGSLFFLLSLALAVLIGHQNKQKKLADVVEPAAIEKSAEETKPTEDQPAPKSLSEELPSEEAAPPVVTPKPAAPESTPAVEQPDTEPSDNTDAPTEPSESDTPAEGTSPDKAPEP